MSAVPDEAGGTRLIPVWHIVSYGRRPYGDNNNVKVSSTSDVRSGIVRTTLSHSAAVLPLQAADFSILI